MELWKGEHRTVRTRRPLLVGISSVCTLLVFLLFSFPNYCDYCSYRNITLYAYSMVPECPTAGSPCTVPPLDNRGPRRDCCAGTGMDAPEGNPGAEAGGHTSVRPVRVPYCLSTITSSIAGSRALPEAVRGNPVSAPLGVMNPSFARLFVALDHKESRAPPA